MNYDFINFEGSILSFGGAMLSAIRTPPPPGPNTLRFRFSDSDTDPTSIENGGTWTKVEDSLFNDWDWACNDTSWANMFMFELTETLDPNIKIIAAGDTSNVNNMEGMFNACTSLTSVPLFDTSNVNNMEGMFNACTSLTSVPPFDTSNVSNMYSMFNVCTSLTSVPPFDTSNVTTMGNMFNGCTSLTTIPLFNTINVTEMEYMFYGCTKVESGALALYKQAFATGKVTNHDDTFEDCGIDTENGLAELQQIPEDWGGLKPEVGAMSVKIEIVDSAAARNWVETNTNFESYEKISDTQYIVTQTNLYWDGLFRITNTAGWPIHNPYLTKVIEFGDISRVDEMGHMFDSCVELISVPARIDTSNVTTVYGMFNNCPKLTKLPLLTYKAGMNVSDLFNGCESASIGLLVNYNAMVDASLSIMYMQNVFTNCGTNGGTHALEERAQIPMEIGGDKIPDNTLLFRFEQAQSKSGPDISNDGTWYRASDDGKDWYWSCDKSDWSRQFENQISTIARRASIIGASDTSKVTNVSYMFRNCYTLTSVVAFNTSNVTNMRDLFSGCQELNDISALAGLDVSKVEDFKGTFYQTPITDLSPVANWNMQSAITIEGMFNMCWYVTDVQPLLGWNLANITNVGGLLNEMGTMATSMPVTGAYELYQKLAAIRTITKFDGCFRNVRYSGGFIPSTWRDTYRPSPD